MDRFRHSRTVAVAVRRLSQATLLRAHITFAGSIIRTCRRSSRLSSPVIARGAPRCGSVAALGLHGFTIRIRVSRAGVGWRVIRRRVQDRVAARRGIYPVPPKRPACMRCAKRRRRPSVRRQCPPVAGEPASLPVRQQVVVETSPAAEHVWRHAAGRRAVRPALEHTQQPDR